MGIQQFCLKWTNYQSNFMSVFEELFSSESLVDVTLACEGETIKAHKMVLSACSPFFQSLFTNNPCQHPIVILQNMKLEDLKSIVEFMYRGEVNVSQERLSALLKAAETLKVKGLAEVTGENNSKSDKPSQEKPKEHELSVSEMSIKDSRSPQSSKRTSNDNQECVKDQSKHTTTKKSVQKPARMIHKQTKKDSKQKETVAKERLQDNHASSASVQSNWREVTEFDGLSAYSTSAVPIIDENSTSHFDNSSFVSSSMLYQTPTVITPDDMQSSFSSGLPVEEHASDDVSVSYMHLNPQDVPTLSSHVSTLEQSINENLNFIQPSNSRTNSGVSARHNVLKDFPNVDVKRPVCPYCHKRYFDLSTFRRHLQMHTPHRRRYACNQCSAVFNWSTNLRTHINNVHSKKSLW